MQTFYKVCLILMIIGGINWGLVGLFQFDFVGWLLGGSSSIWSRIVFTVVGVAAASRGCLQKNRKNEKRLLHGKCAAAVFCGSFSYPNPPDRAG